MTASVTETLSFLLSLLIGSLNISEPDVLSFSIVTVAFVEVLATVVVFKLDFVVDSGSKSSSGMLTVLEVYGLLVVVGCVLGSSLPNPKETPLLSPERSRLDNRFNFVLKMLLKSIPDEEYVDDDDDVVSVRAGAARGKIESFVLN